MDKRTSVKICTGGFNIYIFFRGVSGPDKKVYELSIEFHGEINPAVSILHNIFTFLSVSESLLNQRPAD